MPKLITLFSARPLASAVLAFLCVLLGVVSVSGLIPTSPNRSYFAGHDWLLALLCWGLAVLLAYCAILGRKHQP